MSQADYNSHASATSSSYVSSHPIISSMSDTCPDVCSYASTCTECVNSTHPSGVNSVNCYWCAADQTCRSNPNSCSNYMKVLSAGSCANVLYRGMGIVQAGEQQKDGLEWLEGGNILALTLFTVGLLLVIVLMFMVVKLMVRQTMTAGDVARQRDAQEEHIIRAVPRFGFDNDEITEEPDNSKKDEKRQLLADNAQATGRGRGTSDKSLEDVRTNEREEDSEAAAIAPRLTQCSLCKCVTGGESKRNFIVASEAEQNAPQPWSYVVVLPCRHKLCKNCLLKAQHEAKHASHSIGTSLGGLLSRLRGNNNSGAASRLERETLNEGPSAQVEVVPLGDEEVSSAAVLAALGRDKRCLCCAKTVQCVFIPAKMMK